MQIEVASRLLKEAGAQPVAVRGQMSIGHSFLETPFWWDRESSGGPIVEQVTHYFSVIYSPVHAMSSAS